MGNVSSACENCFGGKQTLPPPKKKEKIKFQHFNTQVETAPTHQSNTLEMTRSLNTTVGTGTKFGRSRTTTFEPQGRKKNDENSQKGGKQSLEDFNLIKVLGRGSFGKVYFVQKKSNKKFYALKTLKKENIQKNDQFEMAMTEKSVLQKASYPFVVRLHYSFQSESHLYFVMDFCAGGELFTHLKTKGRFTEEITLFYATEVILALEYLHDKLHIIYRDLKPENILLDATGHIKITDFGLSKSTKKGKSFKGTPEYIAPEILNQQDYDSTVDWWSLGCLIYEMLIGHPPFTGTNREKLYEYILQAEPQYPSHLSKNIKDLLMKLLTKDPAKRLGVNGADEIKHHPAFEGVQWDVASQLKKRPPFVPILTKPNDLRYFDKAFLKETVAETPPSNLARIMEDPNMAFPSFDFIRKELGPGAVLEEHSLLRP